MNKLAVIGASTGQIELCRTAKRMGLYVICFAWEKNAICRDYVDKFYPISILEMDRIVHICREEQVVGVTSNASDLTARTVAYVSEALGLPGNPFQTILQIENKAFVRNKTAHIQGLSSVHFAIYQGQRPKTYPCIVKPITGHSKRGVSFVSNDDEFDRAISYAADATDGNHPILIENYIQGREFSVETLSYNRIHHVIQITDKVTSGYPHFVELEHHQPAVFGIEKKNEIESIVCRILDSVDFVNGPSHIEMKINDSGDLFLIEVNPRGGGDHIADTLVKLSTGYDYMRGIICAALGNFEIPFIRQDVGFAGIYYLCQQTERLLPFFVCKEILPWVVDREYDARPLSLSTGNEDRSGYVIYQSNRRIEL